MVIHARLVNAVRHSLSSLRRMLTNLQFASEVIISHRYSALRHSTCALAAVVQMYLAGYTYMVRYILVQFIYLFDSNRSRTSRAPTRITSRGSDYLSRVALTQDDTEWLPLKAQIKQDGICRQYSHSRPQASSPLVIVHAPMGFSNLLFAQLSEIL